MEIRNDVTQDGGGSPKDPESGDWESTAGK